MNEVYQIAKDIASLESKVNELEEKIEKLERTNKPEMGFVGKPKKG